MGWVILIIFTFVAGIVVGWWLGLLTARRIESANDKFAGNMILGAGIIFVVIGGIFAVRNIVFIRSAAATDGRVVELRESKGSDGSGHGYAALVEFEDFDGISHKFASQISSSPPLYEVGSHIQVLYQLNKPSRAMIASFGEILGVPLACGAVGIFLIGCGFVVSRWPQIRLKLWPRRTATAVP